MSEVLNNLIKGLAWALGIVSVIGGLYIGIASLGDDAATAYAADVATGWEAVHNQSEARRWEAGVADFYYHHWAWTFHMIAHPHFLRNAWGKAFPPVADLSQYVKGNWWNKRIVSMTFTQRNLMRHFAIPTIAGMVLAVILELILLPLVRARVAKSLASTNRKIFGRTRDLPRGDGFVLAKGVRLDRKTSVTHACTVGKSGAGKNACQLIPSLLSLPDDCGCVVSDPKMENYARTASYLRKRGHKIVVLGPMAGRGTGWDPLKASKSVDDVRKLARQLIEAGDESAHGNTGNWNNMSRTALSAYLIQAWADDLGLADALQGLYADEASGESLTHPAAVLDYRQFESMKQSTNTAGSVLGTIQGACQIWLSEEVVGWMACERQLDMADLRKGAVVYLFSSAEDAEESPAIQRVFFSRLFNFLASSQGADVFVLLDEFCNLGSMKNVEKALNLLRSSGVGIHAFIQNPSQLFDVYGRDRGAVVFESFSTIAVMAGLRNDANDLAKLLGEDSDVRAGYSTQDEKMRAQFSEQRKQAVDGAMLRQIGSKEVLIISGNRKPVMAKLKPWYSRFGLLRYRVFPKIFRKDWGRIPAESKESFFDRIKKIDPIQIVMPPKKEKKRQGEDEKPKRKKTVRIDLDDLGAALAPHIKRQMPAPEDDGYMDALASSPDPFAGLDLGPAEKDPDA